MAVATGKSKFWRTMVVVIYSWNQELTAFYFFKDSPKNMSRVGLHMDEFSQFRILFYVREGFVSGGQEKGQEHTDSIRHHNTLIIDGMH